MYSCRFCSFLFLGDRCRLILTWKTCFPLIDFVDEGRRLALELRAAGAEVVIALTHMRWPNDRRLAQCVDEIDIVLGKMILFSI